MTGSELVEQLSSLLKGIGDLNKLFGIEAEGRRMTIESIKSLRSLVQGEVALSGQNARLLGEYPEAHLDADSNLVLKGKDGKSAVRTLETLNGESLRRCSRTALGRCRNASSRR
ncbi:MAG: hypothetical protein LYZ70_07830 [Nitrososphaerales archaeon]|nr:hypothetical protein [Nitrososphaerales archaeon]